MQQTVLKLLDLLLFSCVCSHITLPSTTPQLIEVLLSIQLLPNSTLKMMLFAVVSLSKKFTHVTLIEPAALLIGECEATLMVVFH